jgi:ribulose-5-phosphate 4-epimerase/fuculose-1-phosphate aldolase
MTSACALLIQVSISACVYSSSTNEDSDMSDIPGINPDILRQFAPRPGRRDLLPPLGERAQVALMCRMLFQEGWDDHIAGHITFRSDDGTLLTNPWELAWDEICGSDIVTLDEEGQHLDGDWNVTPAIGLHIQLHKLRPDLRVVIHNHPRWSSIWANLQRIPPVYDQTAAHCGVDLPLFDEYQGTLEAEDKSLATARALGGAKWALLANHGALVVGKDLRQAHLRAITLEWRCRRAWEAEIAGGGVPLNDEAVQKVAITDPNGFPFLWEAMARRELRRDPGLLD